MSITYQFGGAPEIERIARSVLPEDDPLQMSTFFSDLAENIRGITDAESYTLGYEEARSKLESELWHTIPAHFERMILQRLCHDSDFIAAWAQLTYDWALLFDVRPNWAIRFVLWPPNLWPLALAIYLDVCLSLCGAIAYHLAGPMVLPRLFILTQAVVWIFILAEFAFIIGFFYGLAGSLMMLLLAWVFEGMELLIAPRGQRRLKAIERIKARRLARQARRTNKVAHAS